MKFSAAVLAGGQSRRFGHDKARYVWQGKPLLRWVLDGLVDADQHFIVANRSYPEFGLPVYADVLAGGDSLSGIHSALLHAQHEWVALVACDLPMLSRGYWRYLLGHIEMQTRAVVGVGPGGFPEPLAAFYHRSLIPEVEYRLNRGDLKLQSVIASARAVEVPWSELEQRFGNELYLNANRSQDLQGPTTDSPEP